MMFFMLFHDWISVPPFNNIAALKKADDNWSRLKGSAINGISVIIPLWLTLEYFDSIPPIATLITIIYFYLGLTIGTIYSWWIPYFFGSSKQHEEKFQYYSKYFACSIASTSLGLFIDLNLFFIS
jgi:CDP-diglyceride synthetase